MKKYKICVYAISKNEEHFVDRWYESMKEADCIVVADTGSIDNTIAKLKNHNIRVESITVEPWRFDIARNLNMDMIPDDVTICVCTDLDEVFEPGWRELLEKAWTDETTRLQYTYTHGFYPDGTPTHTFLYEKIHARNHFRWIYPVHEVLDYSGEKPDHYAIEPLIHLKHYPDSTKSRGNYLHLLELSAQFYPEYDRNIHYLGREYLYHKEYDKAIETLQKHLLMPTSTWDVERCASMRYIAKAYEEKGDTYEAYRWYYRSIAEAPFVRESYVDMAKLAYRLEDWNKVLFLVKECLKSTVKTGTYLDDVSSWGAILYDLGSISCFKLGYYHEALSFIKDALVIEPLNERLQNNMTIIETFQS